MAKFKAGESGNPGGRPKGSYSERCREYADAHGWDLLERVAQGKERGMTAPRLRLEAAKLLIAYGYGKPRDEKDLEGEAAPVRFTLNLGEPSPIPALDKMTKEELLALVEATK